MSAPPSAANSIETATALLQSELSRLEEQRRELQNELQSVQSNLAAVSGNIESIRGALAALNAVPSAEPAPETGAEQPRVVPAPEPEDTEAALESTGREVEFEAASPAESVPRGSRFTEQVIAVLARNPNVALRARDVAEALGRDENAGSINAVRSTLDRLVATSRARRAGKGLYQAPAD